jgi:membrane-associated phospholipid phosphatase
MRQNKYYFFLLLPVWITFAILAATFDLQISISIVNENSFWAIFLENYGMLPGIGVLLAGIYIHYSFLITQKLIFLRKGFYFLAANFLVMYLLGVLTGKPELKNLSDKFYLIAAVSILINLLIVIMLHLKKIEFSGLALKFSRIVIVMGFYGYLIAIQLVKTVWGRVRFRELDELFSQFTPWYLPQGITGFDSFPSGHAAMGWMILPVIILFNNGSQLWRKFVIAIICCWGILLSVSRVVIGAHYSSDVLFGSFFIITAYYFSRQRFLSEPD